MERESADAEAERLSRIAMEMSQLYVGGLAIQCSQYEDKAMAYRYISNNRQWRNHPDGVRDRDPLTHG